jgi:dihydroorotase
VELTLRRPDDWHLHLRDGEVLADATAATAAQFGRALVMPNLVPPITACAQARDYRARIRRVAPRDLEIRTTLYLTDRTAPGEIAEAAASDEILGVKLYPAGATTNSDEGVRDLHACGEVLEEMERRGLPLLVHGEVTRDEVDIFDREAVFLDEVLGPLLERHPRLRVVLEHVSSAAGVDFVRRAGDRVAATITAHHLTHTRNDMLVGGIRPHHYCLPILKRERDRQALLDAATGEDPRFFLGTDSAPHARDRKESACGCAGCYTAPVALPLYAMAFEERDALHRLEDFASVRGATFYGLAPNPGRLRLRREAWTVPDRLPFGGSEIVPFAAGRTLSWRVVEA